MTSVRHPPLTPKQERLVRDLWYEGNGLQSVASITGIPSGTLKPYIDTLKNSASRDMKIDQRRKDNPYRRYWPREPVDPKLLSDEEIAGLYNGSRYDDIAQGDFTPRTTAPERTIDMIRSAASAAGLEIIDGSAPGLYSVGRDRDVPLPRLVKLVNNILRRAGRPPLPDPDANGAGGASASRMLLDYSELGIYP